MTDIPKGYKQTEVGVIPEDWVLLTVDSIASTVASGRSHVNSPFGDYPVYGSTGIIGHAAHSDYEGRAILIARVGANAGKLAVVDGEYGVTDNAIMVKIANSVHLDYFWRQLEAKRLNSMVFGSGQPLITGTQIKNLSVPIPPTRAEQAAIAEALGDADALIESLEQLIAKKRHLKQGAMQELLTPKAGWMPAKLGSLGTFLKGSGVRKDECQSGDIPCIRYGEIYTKHTDYIRAFYSWISPAVAATARRLKSGDVLFAGSGETKEEIGKCVAFVGDVETYAGGDIVILRPEKACSMFLGYYLNTAPINRQKASRGQGDAVVHIGAAALADIELSIPTLEEQTTIVDVLADMDVEIAALEAKLAKTRQIKQGMMQELLTGRTRLI